MIRISDIIKMSDSGISGEKNKHTNLEVGEKSIPKVMQRSSAAQERSNDLHERGVNLIKKIIDKVKKDEEISSAAILDFIKTMAEVMLVEDNEQLSKFYETISTQDYLPAHSVNVSFMAMKMGIWLGLNKSELIELSTAAFLHDLGMIGIDKVFRKKRGLGIDERMKLKEHPKHSEQIL